MYFAHPIEFFLALPILKKKLQIYQVWFLFGMSHGVDSEVKTQFSTEITKKHYFLAAAFCFLLVKLLEID